WTVRSAVNDPNRYSSPGTGYRLEDERWDLLQALPYVLDPREVVDFADGGPPVVTERGEAAEGDHAEEVVIAVGPAFGVELRSATESGRYRLSWTISRGRS